MSEQIEKYKVKWTFWFFRLYGTEHIATSLASSKNLAAEYSNLKTII